VDQATKAGLLDLLEQACGQGWTVRGACRVLQVSELRVYRWLSRRAAGELADQAPGGSPVHGLLDWEVAEVVRLFEEWGELDRSHRASSPDLDLGRGSATSRPSGRTSTRSVTRPCCAPSSRWCGSATTGCGCTPASAM
jgi:hypothetical protein